MNPKSPSLDSPLARWLGLNTLFEVYQSIPADLSAPVFLHAVFEAFEATYDVVSGSAADIPATGPVVVMSNHPFGALDGIALADVLLRRRPDTKMLANPFLQRIEQLREVFLAVDPFGSTTSARRSVAGLRRARRWLDDGHALGVLPSGTVSHWQWRQWRVADPPWRTTAARLALATRAAVVPVFFEGRNGWGFQAASMIHPSFRTAMIPRALLLQRGDLLRMRIGRAITPDEVLRFDDASQLTEHLYRRCHALGD